MTSIIVPVYNAAAYLAECLDSVLAQSEPDWELLLVDDGSTDASATIGQAYAKRDARICYVAQPNQGVSAARNHGLRLARGEFVAFLDADDALHPDFLATMLAQDADIVVAEKSRNKRQLASKGAVFAAVAPADFTRQIFLDGGAKLAIWGKLFRTELVRDIAFPPYAHAEDVFWLYLVVQRAKTIRSSTTPLYFYRPNPAGASRKFRLDWTDSVDALLAILAAAPQHAAWIYPRIFLETFRLCQYLDPVSMPRAYVKYRRLLFHAARQSLRAPWWIARRALLTFIAPWLVFCRRKYRVRPIYIKFYANQNLGDDLMLATLCRRYPEQIFAILPDDTAFYQHFTQKNQLKNLLVVPHRRLDAWWRTRLMNHGKLIISVGGSIFQERQPISWRRVLALRIAGLYARARRPLYILNANYGPILTRRYAKFVEYVVGKAKDVCWRDSTSQQQSPNTRMAPDMLLACPRPTIKASGTVIAPINYRVRPNLAAEAVVYEHNLAELTPKNCRGIAFCRPEGDKQALDQLDIRERLIYDGDLAAALNYLAAAKQIIGVRFHSIVLGYAFGAEVVPVSYDLKTDNFLHDLHEQGIDKMRAQATEQFAALDKVLK
ncbi:MAG: glycosyltransferase [Candidatus Nomurabacteria bacterium]|jgi:glycosyltransferase involved in cell wall biosynthesis|nr:glycosyltransferase [Candidatus Nomurabacteria bacterium]